MTVQLEYINHLLQFFKNSSYYASIMHNAFSDLLCSKLCWNNQLVPTHKWAHPHTIIYYTYIPYDT